MCIQTHAHTVGEGASLCSPAVLSDCSVCWATAAVIPPHSSPLQTHAGLNIKTLTETHAHNYIQHTYTHFESAPFLFNYLPHSASSILPPSLTFECVCGCVFACVCVCPVCTVSADTVLCLPVCRHYSIRDTQTTPSFLPPPPTTL